MIGSTAVANSYYDLLGVAPDAATDEIKRAFRLQIARYHPDKVQHLGREFQEIAAVKAAELTQAYRTLTNGMLRADYDAHLGSLREKVVEGTPMPPPLETPRTQPAAVRPVPPRTAPPPPSAAPKSDTRAVSSADRAGASDVLRRAALARLKRAIDAEFGSCVETPVRGFEIACAPPKGRFWSRLPPHVLARVVPQVDAHAVSETWDLASRVRCEEQREVCVFLMGPEVAAAAELAKAIAEEWRRRGGGGRLYLVPVNTRSWAAHIPTDAPPVVKALVARLKAS